MSNGGLKRTLGLPQAIAAAVGLVVASTTLVSLGQGFGLGGPAFIVPMLIAMVINLCVAFSFAELSALIPRAGSINYYTLPAMGRFLGILAVLAGYVIVTIFAGSAEAAVPGLIFQEIFVPGFSPALFSTLFVLLFAIINFLGIEIYGWVQVVLTAAMIGSMSLLGIIGLTGVAGPAKVPEVFATFNPTGWGLLALTSLGFWLFVGIEFVCPLAEEITRPSRFIPIAMISALLIITISNVLYGYASIMYVPLDQLAASATPHVDAAVAILGAGGGIWIGFVSMFATASTVNTLLAAIPRMMYGMALKGELPKVFATLHPRFRTPWVGILVISFAFWIPIWIGITTVETILIYILAAAFSWFVAYIIAHLNVIILRAKYPDAGRKYRSPFFPIPQLLGIAGMIYMMFNIFPDPALRAQIYRYAILFLVLAAAYSLLWVRFAMNKNPFATVPLDEVLAAEDIEPLAAPESVPRGV